jgi:sugar phosphate permease
MVSASGCGGFVKQAISDWIGRRPLMLLGYGISALIRPLMGLVASPVGVIVVRVVMVVAVACNLVWCNAAHS